MTMRHACMMTNKVLQANGPKKLENTSHSHQRIVVQIPDSARALIAC